ncbi:hypothetical protein [Tardiphaga sp. 367_B4_N1_1]|uniref:hypothetical protein n=1 Tax=Tardiphaga sp. 367_B4_N1_1 TaxID=3240777 RepID=UPI003F1FAB96
MQRAGVLADKTVSDIEDKFSKANPSFAGSFLGNLLGNLSTKAIESAIAFAVDLKDRFIDLEKTSHLVGVSMNEIFGIQQAASKSGASVEEVTQSVKGLAVLLDQMQRGESNSLSALLDANPAALQGVNREALTLQQTFGIVADLVENARTEIQKIDIAKAAGQAETMVKFLEKGGDETARLSSNAAAAAPDLQKLADGAKAFDDAWRAAVQNIKAYFSENLFGGFKQDLIDITSILEGLQKFLGLFKNGLLDTQAAAASEQINQLKTSIENLNRTPNPSGVVTRQELGPTGGGTSTRDRDRALSNVPLRSTGGGGPEKDSFDRTEEQITRQTASMNADTIAVFQNNAARSQLRAEFQLLNAIRKDEGEVTQAQIDQYQKLRASMSAEQALKEAAINLSPAHKASFISASEGARVATENFDKARESLSRINQASSILGNALASSFADAVVEGKNLNDVMSSLLKTLAKASINSIFASFFNPTASGGLSSFASLLGIGARAGGGPVSAGQAYVVGENRPELFVPNQSGTIIPSIPTAKAAGGSNVTVAPSYQIDATGADQAAIARLERTIIGLNASLERRAVAAVAQNQLRSA